MVAVVRLDPCRRKLALAAKFGHMYGPAAAGFLHWARVRGARAQDGLGMLLEQAAEAFLLWRGMRPSTAPVLAALRAQLAAEAAAG